MFDRCLTELAWEATQGAAAERGKGPRLRCRRCSCLGPLTDGSYLINRNGAIFSYILNYLRDLEAARPGLGRRVSRSWCCLRRTRTCSG